MKSLSLNFITAFFAQILAQACEYSFVKARLIQARKLSLRGDTRAAISGGVIYTLIGMMVMILVGVLVVNSIISSVTPDTTWSAAANTTWTSTQTNIWLGFGLVVIGLIIVAAVAILSMLRGGQNLT